MNKGYCKVCCKDISHKKASASYCSRKCAKIGGRIMNMPTYICTYCGKKYKPLEKKRAKDKTDYTFCSIRCKTTFLNNGKIQSNEWENIKLIRSNLSEVVKFVKDKFYVRKTYNKVCPITGKEFITTYKKARYSKEGARKITIFKSMLSHSKKWIADGKHNKECSVCGKKYIKMFGDNQSSITCSKECNKEYHRNKSRQRKSELRAKKRNTQTETIDPYKVFNRDKWTCKICGIKTPRKLRGLILDNSPVLDHIMPLSKGGTHTYENVQCLCWRCNSIKSDSMMNVQLNINY